MRILYTYFVLEAEINWNILYYNVSFLQNIILYLKIFVFFILIILKDLVKKEDESSMTSNVVVNTLTHFSRQLIFCPMITLIFIPFIVPIMMNVEILFRIKTFYALFIWK